MTRSNERPDRIGRPEGESMSVKFKSIVLEIGEFNAVSVRFDPTMQGMIAAEKYLKDHKEIDTKDVRLVVKFDRA